MLSPDAVPPAESADLRKPPPPGPDMPMDAGERPTLPEVRLCTTLPVPVLACSRRLDLPGAYAIDRLAKARARTRPRAIVLDCTSTQTLDGTGLAVIVQLAIHLRARGTALVMAGPSPQARAVVTRTRMESLLVLKDSVPAALAVYGGPDVRTPTVPTR